MLLPILHWMPRVEDDIERSIAFVGRQPWGKPKERRLDIHRGISLVRANPGSAAHSSALTSRSERLFELARERLEEERLIRHDARLYAPLAKSL